MKPFYQYGPSHVEIVLNESADEPQIVTIYGLHGAFYSYVRHRYTTRSGFYFNGWYRGDKRCSITSTKEAYGILSRTDPNDYWFPYREEAFSQAYRYDNIINSFVLLTAKEKCGNQLLGDLNEAKFSAAVFYAESRKTLNMLQETAKKLNNLFKWFHGGGYKTLKLKNYKVGQVNDVSNLWLQYKYGWMPLYSEIYQAMINICRPDLNHFIVRAHGSHSDQYKVNDPLTGVPSYIESWEVKCGCTMKADLSITNTALFNVQQLGLENPLEVAWEVIPFSFVADWFLPISNYLSMLTAMQGMTVNSASTTTGLIQIGEREFQDVTVGTDHRSNKISGQYRGTSVNRVLEVPHYPSLSFNNPFKQLKGTAEKTATSFALLRQVLSGKKGAGNH